MEKKEGGRRLPSQAPRRGQQLYSPASPGDLPGRNLVMLPKELATLSLEDIVERATSSSCSSIELGSLDDNLNDHLPHIDKLSEAVVKICKKLFVESKEKKVTKLFFPSIPLNDSALIELGSLLKKGYPLEHLEIRFRYEAPLQKITDGGLQALLKGLAASPTLTSLQLYHRHYTCRNVSFSGLARCTQLKQLQLSNFAITEDPARALAGLLRVNALQKLHLGRSDPQVGNARRILWQAINDNKSLRILELPVPTGKDLDALLDILFEHSMLKEVRLWDYKKEITVSQKQQLFLLSQTRSVSFKGELGDRVPHQLRELLRKGRQQVEAAAQLEALYRENLQLKNRVALLEGSIVEVASQQQGRASTTEELKRLKKQIRRDLLRRQNEATRAVLRRVVTPVIWPTVSREEAKEFEEELRKKEPIGMGAISTVYRGVWEGEDAAFKFMRVNDAEEKEDRVARLKEELRLITPISSPYLVKVLAARAKDPQLIVYELMDGDLITTASSHSDLPGILLDVAHGLLHLHREGIVHGDLKLANILLWKEGDIYHAKLGDFGSTIIAALDEADTVNYAGTVPYSAPEAFEGLVTPASDVFSFGMVLYSVLFKNRGKPFEWPNRKGIAESHEEIRREVEASQSPYKKVILRCLDILPSKRPSAYKLVKLLRTIQDEEDKEEEEKEKEKEKGIENLHKSK